MITDEVLHIFNKNGVPKHLLHLKVGDICLLLRSISKRDKLATNTRVLILSISPFLIRVQTLTYPPRNVNIPRIRFKFRLPFGKSYQMQRTQFPLILAYCVTYNKSQGQEYDTVLIDVRNQPFAHGHLYVALSRVKNADKVLLFCNNEQIIDNIPHLTNVVYDKLLLT